MQLTYASIVLMVKHPVYRPICLPLCPHVADMPDLATHIRWKGNAMSTRAQATWVTASPLVPLDWVGMSMYHDWQLGNSTVTNLKGTCFEDIKTVHIFACMSFAYCPPCAELCVWYSCHEFDCSLLDWNQWCTPSCRSYIKPATTSTLHCSTL